MYSIRTSAQAAWPSSTSVAVTAYAIWSPKSKNPPSGGASMRTSGRVLPAEISTFATPSLPVASVTVRRAVWLPACS